MFKAHGKDRRTVSSRSSKAMMVSAVSCNADEWEKGIQDGGAEVEDGETGEKDEKEGAWSGETVVKGVC